MHLTSTAARRLSSRRRPDKLRPINQPWHERTALQLGAAIGAGEIDPVDLTDHFLERIAAIDTDHAIYVRLTPARARAKAVAARTRAKAGLRVGPLDGVPISWKDLVDTAGTATEGGTKLLEGRIPDHDAVILARATRAGTICLGKTNLPDFAFSGLGINPAYGTPANACDPDTPRVPGGSSAGAAVSVARGLAAIGIGSDTGGSVRIPAALNGLVGLKTTAGLVPLDGVIPLSPTLDTIGPLTRDVADANAMLATLTGRPAYDLAGASLTGVKLLKPTNGVWQHVEPAVGEVFEAGLGRLVDAGVTIDEAPFPEFDELVRLIATHGNMIAAEGYAIWGERMDAEPDKIYSAVYDRFRPAGERSAVDIEQFRQALPGLRASYRARTAGHHAVVYPTAPFLAPVIAELIDDPAAHDRAMLQAAWNTRLGNLLGLSAITLPAGSANGLAVGLMLLDQPFREGALLRLAAAAEAALSR